MAASSVPSMWGTKMEKRLSSLSDTASIESIQTLANWICFNRRQAATIATTFSQALVSQRLHPSKRQLLYWKVLHAVLTSEEMNDSVDESLIIATTTSPTSRQDHHRKRQQKQLELRKAIGESLSATFQQLGDDLPVPELEVYLKKWEDSNVFGSPTLVAQIRRFFRHRNTTTSAAAISTTNGDGDGDNEAAVATTTTAAETETKMNEEQNESIEVSSIKGEGPETENRPIAAERSKIETVEVDHADDDVEMKSPDLEPESRASLSSSGAASAVDKPVSSRRFSVLEYDFTSKGVPEGKVEPRELMDPCKAITSLQIARDVRTNSAVERSADLANLPADILETCESLERGDITELDEETINDFSMRIPSKLLDLNVEEELSSLAMFQDIVQRQKMAREKLIYLLLKSRCQFGAREAAEKFYELGDGALEEKLKKRKQLLSDALELEGLDTSQIDAEETKASAGKKGSKKRKTDSGVRSVEEDLPPFDWYKAEE